MNFNRKIFFMSWMLVLNLYLVQAQIPFFKVFQVDKERSGIRVLRMLKDNKGLIWLGTSEGLYKFNGVEFTKITAEFIRDSSVTALFEDSRGRLWVGFRSGKIATLENNYLKLFLPQGTLPKTAIHAIAEDREFRIWFATNGQGVYYYLNNNLYNINSNDGLSDDYTYALAFTASVISSPEVI